MDVHARLRKLLKMYGWSEYRLAKKCGLSESTISNIFRRGTYPTIPTLELICDAFGITLSDFFAEEGTVEMTPEMERIVVEWLVLTPKQKEAVLTMIQSYHEKEDRGRR